MQSLSSPESLGSRIEDHAFLRLYDCLDLFSNIFFSRFHSFLFLVMLEHL